ncbi:hypothetical protein [Anaeroselena agilis]|uniref:Hypervirulence associated protein TUDOR domain-containing protein n=1 Tax=Anaeroselena agilis TaxID=3063788 RepID=A0ABU3P186_9FIRM|nr:hypothetical protein [Selenomonadales bacterium 4137-cl]
MDSKTPTYKFWNGKNLEGSSVVGDPNLIAEGPRTGKTAAKYEVANETVSADNLQKDAK